MRSIIVSTDVFAALWARRRPDEDGENAILERLLGLPRGPSLAYQAVSFTGRPRPRQGGPDGSGGIYNSLFDVRFPAGFEIFRVYKGRRYGAVVRDGRWVMGTESFPSLFALSTAIIDSRENPWMHWKYRDAKGQEQLIITLRKTPQQFEETSAPDHPAPRTSRKSRKNPK